MVEEEYVSIQEAARRCGVSGKTIQRAIQAGKLAVQYPKPNQCKIAISALETFRPGHVSGHAPNPAEVRITALERRVEELERQLCDLVSKQKGSEKRRIPKNHARTTGPLPRNLVSLLAFAQRHNLPEHKVLAATQMGLLPVKRGEWTDTDGTLITLALDKKGRTAFFQTYRDLPLFVRCKQCPHGY